MSFIGRPSKDSVFDAALARANALVQTGFTTINVATSNTGPYTDIRANTTTDMLTILSGRGVILTSNATTDTLTLSMSNDLSVSQTAVTKALTTWSGIAGTLSTKNLLSVTWSPELRLFVASANTAAGDNGNIVTSPDGIHWTSRDVPLSKNWLGLTWSPELKLFVAFSDEGAGNRAMTSPDGITWTTRTTPLDNIWYKSIWVKELGLFVATSDSGGADDTRLVMTSPDGTNWTDRATTLESVYGAAWSPELGLLVSLGSSATNQMMTSPDGITWTARALPAGAASKYFSGVTWSPELGLFVAMGNAVMTSPNGITWTVRTFPSGVTAVEDLIWVPHFHAFVGVVYTGSAQVVFSFDGITWTSVVTLAAVWVALTWSPGLGILVAIGHNGTTNIVTSKKVGLWSNINTRPTPAQVTSLFSIGA